MLTTEEKKAKKPAYNAAIKAALKEEKAAYKAAIKEERASYRASEKEKMTAYTAANKEEVAACKAVIKALEKEQIASLSAVAMYRAATKKSYRPAKVSIKEG